MCLKEKIKPLFFALSLILGVFVFISPALAGNTGIVYTANYSTDHGFRLTDIYFDSNDYLIFNFTLLNSSDKDYAYISEKLTGSSDNWQRPDIVFNACQNCAIDSGNNNNYIKFYGYICEGTSQYYSWAGTNMYAIGKGENLICRVKGFESNGSKHALYSDYIKRSDMTAVGADIENTQKWLNALYANFGSFYSSGESYYGFQNSTDHSFPFTSMVDASCGIADNNLPTTIPIPDGEACSSGTVDNMHEAYSFDGIIYYWSCLGSGGGISTTCETLPYPNPINGSCGTANNTTVYNQPEESEKCSAGATNSTTLITLTGWSWVCEGLYGGNNETCSATYAGGGTTPTIPDTAPIPTPTDCDTYSGIDKILCNFGNTIQGMFLPSTEKLTELQNTLNSVGNVFPFNYLRIIGNTFSNTTITEGSLTMTMWGNTETINPVFWDLPIFEKIKLFSTILILLMFTFWAVGYIKHFFK